MTLDTGKTHVTYVLGKLGPKAPANPRSKWPCLRVDPALVRIHDLPGGHLTTSEHPNLLANLIRALPQPRSARPRSGPPPHPISTEGNQQS